MCDIDARLSLCCVLVSLARARAKTADEQLDAIRALRAALGDPNRSSKSKRKLVNKASDITLQPLLQVAAVVVVVERARLSRSPTFLSSAPAQGGASSVRLGTTTGPPA